MFDKQAILTEYERVALALRELYARHGYSQYTMNRFEEYDLYARNKDFLVSDGVITFTDTNGRLLALKPDVTLSIIKNGRDGTGLQKLYYQENVYRVSPRTRSFAELMQVGLECVGKVDACCIFEVLSLAAKSLAAISKDCVLDISHLGILSALLDGLGVDSATRRVLLRCIGDKNMHELRATATAAGADAAGLSLLISLLTLPGDPATVLAALKKLPGDRVDPALIADFCDTVTALCATKAADMLRIDFSVTGNMRYYNGIVFKGFVAGLPTGILSGGQYDRLMEKMGRSDAAIGFAVYLDPLERLSAAPRGLDADILVCYAPGSDPALLEAAIAPLRAAGERVLALPTVPADLCFGRLLKFDEREGLIDETKA